MNRILLIRRGGLGDTLLMTASLRALRRRHPGAQLHLAGVRDFVDVLQVHGVVDGALSSEDFLFWSPARLAAQLSGYDQVFGDEPTFRDGVLHAAAVEAGAPFALQAARQLGLEPRWPADGWLLSPRSSGPGPIVLAPGSGGAAKCWPRGRWLELAERLDGAPQVVVGPVEIERDDPRRWPWPVEVSFVVEASATGLARVLAEAGCFVGNDSGTTHLAAMLGVPTVAVFVTTDPSVWAPVGPHVQVAGGSGVVPSVDDVWRALSR